MGNHNKYSEEFRSKIIELARAGAKIMDLSKEFGPHTTTIRGWIAQSQRDHGVRVDGLMTDERAELRKLRRENKQLKIEREILAKAAAWFARETDKTASKHSS